MNEEQWNEFYNLLRDILKNNDYRFVGLDAFNEINTLLILVFIEDKLDNFNFENPEMLKLSYIYDLFYTNFEKRMKDEKMKGYKLTKSRKNNKIELYNYLFEKMRNYERNYDNGLSYEIKKKEDDLYYSHLPCVFSQILNNDTLNRLFIRTKLYKYESDNESNNESDNESDYDNYNYDSKKCYKINVDYFEITSLSESNSDDIYKLIKKIVDTFYIKDENGILQSIFYNDSNNNIIANAYEKFITDNSMYDNLYENKYIYNSKNISEYFTRRDIITYIIQQLDINENDIVYDPSAGTGGFLLESIRSVKNKLLKDMENGNITQEDYDNKFENFLVNNIHGNEIEPEVYRSLMINIMMNYPKGQCLNNLLCVDSLLIENEDDEDNDIGNITKALNFSTVSIGNPPYGRSLIDIPSDIRIDKYDGNEIYADVDDKSAEYYYKPIMNGKNIIVNYSAQFSMHFIRCLKDNGKTGFITDRKVLTDGSNCKKSWNKSVRKFMIEENKLTKIVLLSNDILGYNLETCIIFLTKNGKTENVIFEELYLDENKKFYVENTMNVTYEQLKGSDYSLNPIDFNKK